MRKYRIGALCGLAALLVFASAAHAETTVSLIWQATGSNEIVDPLTSSNLVLDVLVNGDATGTIGGGITVDYGNSGALSVVGFISNFDGIFSTTVLVTTDTGSQVRNINGLNPFGPLAFNGTVRLGTITFHKEASADVAQLTTLYTATDGIDGLTLASSFGTAKLIDSSLPTPIPTPTPVTPTATPAPTPTSEPACAGLNPVPTIVTTGKGQSPTKNAKVFHSITGNIINPGSIGSTAHRIEVCTGTAVSSTVVDATGTATNSAGGSLTCDGTGCFGLVNAMERYQSVSQDGRDKDRITFIPRENPPPPPTPTPTPTPVPSVDADGDGIVDSADNCIPPLPFGHSAANPAQTDTDSDGCGNICDPDYSQGGVVGKPAVLTAIGAMGTISELHNHTEPTDDVVGFQDLILVLDYFALPPGPSGTTAGTTACP